MVQIQQEMEIVMAQGEGKAVDRKALEEEVTLLELKMRRAEAQVRLQAATERLKELRAERPKKK